MTLLNRKIEIPSSIRRYIAVPKRSSPLIVKLWALRRLSDLLGFSRRPTDDEVNRRLERWGVVTPALCMIVIMDKNSSAISRAACADLLEFFMPGWRQKASSEALGMVVERNDTEVRKWRRAVFERDGRRCVSCGSDDQLEAHHINRWVDAPWLRVVVDNGMTLCEACHRARHATGGYWSAA